MKFDYEFQEFLMKFNLFWLNSNRNAMHITPENYHSNSKMKLFNSILRTNLWEKGMGNDDTHITRDKKNEIIFKNLTNKKNVYINSRRKQSAWNVWKHVPKWDFHLHIKPHTINETHAETILYGCLTISVFLPVRSDKKAIHPLHNVWWGKLLLLWETHITQ